MLNGWSAYYCLVLCVCAHIVHVLCAPLFCFLVDSAILWFIRWFVSTFFKQNGGKKSSHTSRMPVSRFSLLLLLSHSKILSLAIGSKWLLDARHRYKCLVLCPHLFVVVAGSLTPRWPFTICCCYLSLVDWTRCWLLWRLYSFSCIISKCV